LIKIEEVNYKVYIYTPYNKNIIDIWHKLNGRWNSENNCWVFNSDLKEEIENFLF
jgi:hypothetical protein